MPAQQLAFARFPFPNGIHPALTQQQWLGFRHALQPGQVILERLLVVEVNIETDKVHGLRPHKFRRRVICERAQAFRVRTFGFLNEPVNELGDGRRAAPAHDVGRNFVGDAVGEDRRVPRAAVHSPAHCVARRRPVRRRIQETKLLVPRNINQHLQPVLGRQVEKPFLRNVIDPNEVGAQLSDLGEVTGGLLRGGESRPLGSRVWRERPVRHAFDVEFLFAQPEKFAIHAHAWTGGNHCHGT